VAVSPKAGWRNGTPGPPLKKKKEIKTERREGEEVG